MDTFPIVRRKDEEKYNGDYRTKRVILEIYDAMQRGHRDRPALSNPPRPAAWATSHRPARLATRSTSPRELATAHPSATRLQMKAIDRQFTKIINGTTQFVIPVFQRDTSHKLQSASAQVF